MADWETIVFIFFNITSLIVGSCANLLIIISFIVFNWARQPTEILLVSLSVADFLVCSVYQPLLVLRFIKHGISQVYISFFGYSLMTASMNGLLAVNFDRFVAIYFPYKYMNLVTEKTTTRLTLISWVISFSTGVLVISNIRGFITIVYLYNTLTIALVPIIYGVIYREARKQARRIISQSLPSAQNHFPNRSNMMDKATRGIGLVLVTTRMCWLPIILFPALMGALITDEEIHSAISWCLTAACVNSCINPFIYFYKFSKFRRNVRKLLQMIRGSHVGRLPMFASRNRSKPISHAFEVQQIGITSRAAWVAVQELPN